MGSHYMNQFETDIALPETTAQKVARRDKNAKIIQQMIELAKQLEVVTYELSDYIRYPQYIDDRKIEDLRQKMDVCYWRECLEELQVDKYLTTVDKNKLFDDFSEKCPVFNEANVENLICTFRNSQGATATNMIKKIYTEVTDIVFRVGNKHSKGEKRIQTEIPTSFRASIFSSHTGYPSYVSCHTYNNFALIDDLERACYLCDGKTQPDRNVNIRALTDTALREQRYEIEGPYFDLKIFKNGNVQIKFRSAEVLKTLNKWGRTGNRLGSV